MAFYWLLFVILSLVSLIPFKIKERRMVFIAMSTLLVIVASLRASITSDHDVYLAKFLSISNGESDEGIEFSYAIISNIVANTINNFNGLLFIYAFIAISAFAYAAVHQTKSFLLVLPYFFSYYFFLQPMTQIREAVAASFLLVSLEFIKKNKILPFLIVIMIGACFHVSLLLFLPFYYILRRISLNLKSAFVLVLLSIIISQFHILNLVLGFDLNSESYLISKIYMHKNTVESGLGERTAGAYIIMIYFKLLFNFILRYKEKSLSIHSKYFYIFLNLHFYGCLSYLLLSDIHIIAGRVSELLCVVELFLVPYFIYIFKPRIFGKILVLCIALFQLVIALYIVHLSGPYMIGSFN